MSEKPVKRKLRKRTWVAAFFIVLVIPALLIIFGGSMQGTKLEFDLFGNPVVLRLFYAVSLAIIIMAMVPFFMIFEKRRPQARELVIIATLAAIAVAGRAAFFMIPQFKPVCAIVIIAGVCFGGESGFLVGAVTGLVSNFFYGQGAHTPWQMVCFGVVGFLAGVLFQKGLLSRSRLSLCIYGFFATFFIYGGVMNFSTILTAGLPLNLGTLITVYTAGIPMDLIHAGSTVIFLLVLANPMIEKLERIKTKYGLLEP